MSALADALRRYAAEEPPWHDGDGAAALAAVQQSRPRRLERLAALLRVDGIDLHAALASTAHDGVPFALDRWCGVAWPPLARREFAWPQQWRARVWQPQQVARLYTLIVDVGVALGEWVIGRRSGLTWGVDRYPAHEADGIASFGRVVVVDPATAVDAPRPPVYDALDAAFMRYQSIAYADGAPGRFIDGMRPLLWASHRGLFVGAGRDD
jgi:hypothetical protein